MRLKLAMSPWWVQALFYGLFFGTAMTILLHLRTGEWLGAALGGLLGGAFFGVFMAYP